LEPRANAIAIGLMCQDYPNNQGFGILKEEGTDFPFVGQPFIGECIFDQN
jgi:hypothetical protein